MGEPNDYALVSRTLGGLPIFNDVLDRLGLPALLAGARPAGHARVKLAPAVSSGSPVLLLAWGLDVYKGRTSIGRRGERVVLAECPPGPGRRGVTATAG